MATISVSLPSDGDTIDAADVNTPINTIVSAINGNLDSNNISAGGVTPANLTSGTGTSWTWQTWTPSYTNLSIGNGVVVSKYTQIGKTVHFKFKLTWGSTTSGSGTFIISFPVTATSDLDAITGFIGGAEAYDLSGLSLFLGQTYWASTTTFTMKGLDASNVTFPFATAAPMTWATGDILYAIGTYEAA